ncbi:MAG: hypothetical protein E7Z73_11180, partial [Methanobrevibacter millerae]
MIESLYRGENIKTKYLALISIVLVLFTIGAVSAADDLDDTILADTASVDVSQYYVDSNVATTGDGSQSSPFKTIGEAIDLTADNKTVEIYLAGGTYSGENNTNFDISQNHQSAGGSISLIGSDSGVLIDLGDANKFIKLSQYGNLTVKNIKFTNFTSPTLTTYNDAIIWSDGWLNVDNCDFTGSITYSIYGTNDVYISNSRFYNNTGHTDVYARAYNGWTWYALNVVINNCNFTNDKVRYQVINLGQSNTAVFEVKNCLFENTSRAINQDGRGVSHIENCKFLNVRADADSNQDGGAMKLGSNYNSATAYVSNCEFINTTATRYGAAIYVSGDIYLSNNTAKGNTAMDGDFIYLNPQNSNFKTTTYLTVLNNETVEIDSSLIPLTATLVDDMGNSISGAKITFYIDDTQVGGQTQLINGTAKYDYKAFLIGNHTVSAKYNTDCVVNTATLICNPESNKKIYISKDGDDDTGDGSEAKPYASIEKGMEVAEETYNSTIYVKAGTYDYLNYHKVDIIGLKYNIIGYGGEVIIDMKDTTSFGSFKNADITFSNLKFINGYNEYIDWNEENIFNFGVGNYTFINCTFENNHPYDGYAVISGSQNIISCVFKDNSGVDGDFVSAINGYKVNVVNSTFYNYADSYYPSIQASILNVSGSRFIGGRAIQIDGEKLPTHITSCEFIGVTSNFINMYRSAIIMDNCEVINSTNVFMSATRVSGTTEQNNITNNKFINCTSNGIIRSYEGYVFEANNTMIDCGSTPIANLYSSAQMLNHLNIEILENKTIEIESFGATVKISVTDDEGNIINLGRLTVYLNDESIGTASLNENTGLLELNYKKLLDGTYIVNAISPVSNNYTVKTATLVITPLMKSELWVDLTGDDETGDGSQAKPYRTLDHAMEMAGAYENIIHMGSGVFNIASPLKIVTGGGILNIVGDNTVIDLESNSRFIDSISSDSVVILENLDIINGYATSNSGTIQNGGNLTVNNVSFINSVSAASWNGGGAIYSSNELYVLNSKFINCTAYQGGAIYNTGYLYLENNTIDNVVATSGTGNYVFTTNNVDNVIVTVMNNGTYDIDGSFTLNATVTDDMGNPISAQGQNNAFKTIFYLNGIEAASAYLGNGIVTTSNINLKLNGQYIASAVFGTVENVVYKTATLNFVNNESLSDAWVSKDGNDETGDGSEANPFATIGKALQSVLSIGSTIHVKEGTYIFTSQQLISNLMDLTIKGEDDGVIISGNNQNKLFKIDAASSVTFDNLRLTEGRFGVDDGTDQGVIQNNGKLYINNCTIDNHYYSVNYRFYDSLRSVAVLNTGTLIVNNTLFKDNAYVVDSYNNDGGKGAAIYSTGTLEVYNSDFECNSLKPGSSGASLGAAIYATNGIILKNSNFINNTIDNSNTFWGAVVYVTGGTQTIIDNCNFNENFVQNKNTGQYGSGSVISAGSNAIISNSTFNLNKLNAVRFTGIVDNISVTNGEGGVYIDKGTVKNSYFNNITGYVFSAYGRNDASAINNVITNVNGSAIQMNSYVNDPIYEFTVTNNTFINISAVKGAIAAINYGIVNIYNNTIINNTASDYADYIIVGRDGLGIVKGSDYKIIFNDNSTTFIDGNKIKLNATIMDSDGNIVYNARIFFVLDDVSLGFADIGRDGYAYLESSTSLNGTHIISGYSNNVVDPEILTGTLTISQIDNIVVYVDASMGDDETGDGSEDNPFKSLSKGLEVASSANDGTVYIVGDYYGGELNYNIDVLLSPKTNLTIIGIGEEDVFIDLTNASYLFKIVNAINSDYSNFVMKNVIIANLETDNEYPIRLDYVETELDNVIFENITSNSRTIITPSCDNVILTNCVFRNIPYCSGLISNPGTKNLTIVNVCVYNSSYDNGFGVAENTYISNVSFVNNTGSCIACGGGSSIVELLIENSIFIDNAGAEYHGGVVIYNIARSNHVNVTNCVIVNNYSPRGGHFAQGYGNGLVCDNNWWGTNSDPNRITDLIANLDYKINNWVVADVTPSELPIKKNSTITVKFLSNDGSELENVLPARVVEAIADSAIFENGQNNISYTINGNEVSFTVLPDAFGTVNLTIDNQEFTLNIVKANSTVLLDVFDTTTVDGLTAVATVNDDATGEVVFTLSNGESYTVNIINGAATLFLDTISAGEYNITAVYGGDDLYNGNEASASFKVTDIIVSAADVKFAYKDPNAELVAVVTDENGNPLVVNLNVEFNGENSTVTTDADGQAIIPIGNLTPGKYNAVISYQGSSKTASANALVTVTKAATSISADDVNIAYKDPNGEIVATIISEHGKGLAVNLNVELNGKTYTVRTDSNGQAVIPVGNLTPGKYNAKISYKGSSNYKASSATVLVTVTKAATSIDAGDVNIAYRDPSGELVATITSEHGKTLIVNLNIELNGKTYTVRTDSNGQAVLSLYDVTPGTYDAKISYKGSSNYKASTTTAKVTVTKSATSIDAGDVSIAYRDPTGELVATVTNEHGKTLVVTLSIELNGKTYNVRTDANGQAVLSLYDVTPGTYDAKISYKGSSNYKGFTTTAKVVVTKAATSIDAGDVNIAYRDPTGELVATVTNEHGKALIVTVNIELNGKTYNVRTDANGQAVLSLYDVTPGTYDVKISYKGSSNYKAASTTAKVVVTKSDTMISAPDVSVAYGDPDGKLVSTIVNEHGKPLVVNM